MQYVIPEETINNILAYLGKCPYTEVYLLINDIRVNMKPLLTPEPQQEGSDGVVQSSQTESTQSQTTDEGGQQSVSQESQDSQQ